jgi:predicted nucleic acid-binding protein
MEYLSDTWFLVALLDERDAHPEEASNFADTLASVQITTRWALAEVANSLAAPFARRQVVQFLRKLENNPLIRVIGKSDGLFARGFDLYASWSRKGWWKL